MYLLIYYSAFCLTRTSVTVTTKLGELQKNYETHWAVWERAMESILILLTPTQKARILLRKKAHLDNINILNSIWSSING